MGSPGALVWLYATRTTGKVYIFGNVQMRSDLPAKTTETAPTHLAESFGSLKRAQKVQQQAVTLVKMASNVPSASQHELQVVFTSRSYNL
eukprot:6190565-Pleurochrysis_carterae.AAC.3